MTAKFGIFGNPFKAWYRFPNFLLAQKNPFVPAGQNKTILSISN
jgi:hypothetical protein